MDVLRYLNMSKTQSVEEYNQKGTVHENATTDELYSWLVQQHCQWKTDAERTGA